MSILIKGMNIPKSCIVCPFIGHYPDDRDIPICYPIGRPLDDTRVNLRPDWCPLKEVKHGHWEEIRPYDVRCSVCKNSMMDKYPFCPECGAKMDE